MEAREMNAWAQARAWVGALCEGAPDLVARLAYMDVELDVDALLDPMDLPPAADIQDTDRRATYRCAYDALTTLAAHGVDQMTIGLVVDSLERAWETEQASQGGAG
ncbi:hypothetical protein GCM10028784_16640 [Myceligenerans cantabricum]